MLNWSNKKPSQIREIKFNKFKKLVSIFLSKIKILTLMFLKILILKKAL